jgi:cyanophycinase-like exopeptidase
MKRKTILFVGALLLTGITGQSQSLGRVGSATDAVTATTAGTVLMGGGSDVDAAFTWMINKSGGGDFVVIRATGTNAYNSYIFGLGPANSVETFLINSVAQANDAALVETIKKAEAVFFAGGNQNDYISYYKGTALGTALDYLANTKHVPIGGTSAGMAIQGSIYYDGNTNVLSTDVLPNPYLSGTGIHYNDFFQNPFLQNTICDTHFNTKGGTTTNGITGRQGRLMTFLSRMITDQTMTDVKAIACDEKTAVCIDENGLGMVVGLGKAYFLRQWCNVPETCVPGQPLTWSNGVKVYKISGPGSYTAAPAASKSVDLTNWTAVTGGDYEYWTVNAGVLTIGQTTATPSICTILNVSEAAKEDPIQIYPNPSTGSFHVTVSENNATITIRDMLGKTILQQPAIGNSCDLELKQAGFYMIHVTTTSGTTSKKLIVKE